MTKKLNDNELEQVSGGNSGVYGGYGIRIPEPILPGQTNSYEFGSVDSAKYEFGGGSDGGRDFASSYLEEAKKKLNQTQNFGDLGEQRLKQIEEEMEKKLEELMGVSKPLGFVPH